MTTDKTDDIVGQFVTLRLTTKQPGTNRAGKDIFVSGVITSLTDTKIGLEVESHDDWTGRSSTRTVELDRSRIRRSSRDLDPPRFGAAR